MDNIFTADEQARIKIRTEFDKNFFVEAGAGSGKTYSLVERMISMVKNGRDVRRICAITFTKAAAAEFYRRFHEALLRELAESRSDKEKKRIEDAVKNIDLCFMGTIDSFCNMVLSEHPRTAGIPSDACVTPDEEMEKRYEKEYSAISKGNHGEELRGKQERFAMYVGKDLELFKRSIKYILETRNTERVYERPDISLEKYLDDETAEIREILRKADKERDIAVPDKYLASFKSVVSRLHFLENDKHRNYDEIKRLLNDISELRFNKEWKSAERFPSIEQGFLWGKFEYYWINKPIVPVMDAYIAAVALDFLVPAADAIAQKLKEQGVLTYFDYLLYLRDILKADAAGDGKLIRHIAQRHSYFLIDEFQDTDPLQAEIFFYLAAEKPVENWRQCVPRPGALFVVGDPKQSIYRFRNADIASYMNVRGLFPEENVLRLSRNFRSSKQMCDSFNKAFEKLMPSDTKSQSKFRTIPNEKNYSQPENTFGGVFRYTCPATAADNKKKDPQEVYGIIKGLVHDPEHLIFDSKEGVVREIRYDDIMVITHGKERTSTIAEVLKKNDIPVFVEGDVELGSSPALAETVRLFCAIADPYDDTAVYAALRGKVFGITDEEIDLFISRTRGGHLRLNDKEERKSEEYKGCERMTDALSRLALLRKETVCLSPFAVFEEIQRRLRVLEKTGTENYECFCYAIELLRQAESGAGISTLSDAAAFLRRLVFTKKANERCLSLSASTECVHIANCHKVKGLEAQIVILADPNFSYFPLLLRSADEDEKRKSWIFMLGSNTYGFKTSGFEYEKELENICLEDEKTRLLYVAATRARCALIIADKTKRGDKKKGNIRSESSPWYKLLECLDPVDIHTVLGTNESCQEVSDAVSISELYDKSEKDDILKTTLSLERTYELKLPSKIKLKSKPVSEETSDNITDKAENSEEGGKKNAALTGTLIHRLMEMLVVSGDTICLEDAVKEIIGEYEGADESYMPMLLEVGKKIRSGGYEQEPNGMPADILSELLSADEVHCEVPFCQNVTREGCAELRHGVIDLLYNKKGRWRIVDYKTNADGKALDEKYKEQLEVYKLALEELTGIKAETFIYHIDK